jgi:DNA repair protein RadD
MQLRPYQQEASDSVIDYLDSSTGGEHPIIALPTGSGKTPVLCDIVDQILSEYPEEEIIVLSHVKEILEQDYNALCGFFDGIEIGLYSAGLSSRTKKRVTVAGIQSVYQKIDLFKDTGIILIDECHLISPEEESMYRSFFHNLGEDVMYIGLTATPYRLGQGYLHQGKNALFTEIICDYTTMDKFNFLIDEGYLSMLYVKSTIFKLDTTGIKKQGGDFSQKDLSKKLDRIEITSSAIAETLHYGKKYKRWIVFAIDIEHAKHIAEELNKNGIRTACVHSKMGDDESRDLIIKQFRAGEYRCIVNVDILTTGFDVPDIDMIVLLRPTQSPVFHSQSIGRGLRVVYASGMPISTKDERLAAIKASVKKHCFVLDFAGNTARLGPVNDIQIKTPKEKGKGGGGDPIVKICPNCDLLCHTTVKFCPACNWKFDFKQKITASAEAQLNILRREQGVRLAEIEKASRESLKKVKAWVPVSDVQYAIHEKPGKPSSLKVTYTAGIQQFQEWITLDHSGFNRSRSLNWVKFRLPLDLYNNKLRLNDLWRLKGYLKMPTEILIDNSGDYVRISDAKLPEKYPSPEPLPEPKNIHPKPKMDSEKWDEDDIPF